MFERPSEMVSKLNRFSGREVGLTHPDTDAFIKLSDTGDIEYVATDGLAIIMHPQNKSITFIADHVKFLTKDRDGLRWNKLSFNSKATKNTEPTFVTYEEDEVHNIYNDTDYFLGD